MSMEEAKRTAIELGLAEPDDGAFLSEQFGMSGRPAERELELIESEILLYKRQAGGAIIEIGKRLREAKAQLSHGEWLPWLREKVDISERSATNFMRLSKEYEKSAEIADLGASKALALLALPDSERAEFAAEKHRVDGEEKSVSEMTAKELKQAIRERDEARQAEERAKADAAAAEESRVKMEQDVRALKELQERAQAAAEEKAAELTRVEEELKSLREKPTDVAIEYRTDPEELAKAKEEGLTEARRSSQNILDAKEQELVKLRDELQKARKAEKEASVNFKRAEQEAKDARADAERAKREAAVKGNPDTQAFKLFFDQAQKNVNEMADLAKRAEAEQREKMCRAMLVLSDAIRKAAGA